MDRILSGLEPERVFYYFEEISQIPRPSGRCKMISDYVVNFAKDHNLEYVQDSLGNVLVRKPSNREDDNRPVVIL